MLMELIILLLLLFLELLKLPISILLGHVSRPELSMCLFLIRPRGRIDLYHVFVCIGPRALSWLLHVSFAGSSRCQILI